MNKVTKYPALELVVQFSCLASVFSLWELLIGRKLFHLLQEVCVAVIWVSMFTLPRLYKIIIAPHNVMSAVPNTFLASPKVTPFLMALWLRISM